MAKDKVLTKAEVLKQVEAAKKDLDKIQTRKVGKHVGGFMDFIRKQGIVGLAIGLAIGTQATDLVKNIVNSVITPIVDLMVGPGGLTGLTWTVDIGNRHAVFRFGLLIDSLIKFLAVALVIYLVVTGFKLDKLDKKKDS